VYEVTTDIAVPCTQEQAFEHVARGFFEHHGLWDSTVTSMEKTSKSLVGLGARGREERRVVGSRVASEFQESTEPAAGPRTGVARSPDRHPRAGSPVMGGHIIGR
jgi:hypothetical protein